MSDKVKHLDPFARERIEKTKHTFLGFLITRSRITAIILIAILALGAIATLNIPRESDPEVKIPIAIVTTLYLGASPADVEQLVTDKIESKIEELDNVKLVTSSSVLGLSSIVIEFNAEADLDKSVDELKSKIDEVVDLPSEAEDPIVTQIRANDQAIITFSLAGNLSTQELKHLGEHIQDELEAIKGVSRAPLSGVQARELSVVVNRGRLEQAGISLNTIVGALASSNLDTPIGALSIDGINYNIRAVATITSAEELGNVVVGVQGTRSILLKDVATITDQLADVTTLSRLSVNGAPATNTVSLSLFKKTGGNILEIVDAAKEKIESLQTDGTIPSTVSVVISSDFSQFIRKDLNTLGSSGIQSVVLIFIVLLIALSLKEALISLFAIPVTFLITLSVLYFRGDTINSLSLFALVLSLGLLVDTFVVMLEGIFHNIRNGYTAKDAALLTVAHYRNPLLAGTLTTISAFVPMLLVSGILGEYLKVLPITISAALLSSLFVSLAIVPALAGTFLKGKASGEKKESLLEKFVTNRLRAGYHRHISGLLLNRKRKLRYTLVTIVLFITAMGTLVGGLVPVQLFPNVDIDFSYIDVEMPIGTELEVTDELVKQVENYLYQQPEIENFVTTVGQSAAGFDFISSGSTNEHVASITLTYVGVDEREEKSYEINNRIREDLKQIKQGTITVREVSSGPPTGSPIEARIIGPDMETLNELADQVIAKLEQTVGVINVDSNRQISPANLTFRLNREALAASGLAVGDVSRLLRTAVFGVTATEVKLDGEEIDVVVSLNESQINSVEALKNLSLTNAQGQSVALSRVAEFSLEPALASINHRDFERTITVQADLEPGYVAATVTNEVSAAIDAQGVPTGYQVIFGGEVEDIEQSFNELWTAMIVAVILILLILILEFDSFTKTFVIMLTLPLAIIGVVIGMLLFRLPFSFSTFLGIISLAGIVVNEAIVMLDKCRRNLEENNMSPRESIAEAGQSRLQSIILTSGTTIIGIAPLIFADEFWLGLSVAMIFGLIVSSVLQLYIIPIFYLQLEGKHALKRQAKRLAEQK